MRLRADTTLLIAAIVIFAATTVSADGKIYWVRGSFGGGVWSADLDGSDAEELLGQQLLISLAVDTTGVPDPDCIPVPATDAVGLSILTLLLLASAAVALRPHRADG